MVKTTVIAFTALAAILFAPGPSTADGRHHHRHRHHHGHHHRHDHGWHHRHHHHHGGVRLFIGVPPHPHVVYQPPRVYRPAPPPVWHYCESYGAYYPSVPMCPEGWVLVPAR